MAEQTKNKLIKISSSYASIAAGSSMRRRQINHRNLSPSQVQTAEPINELQKFLEKRLRDFHDSFERKLKNALNIINDSISSLSSSIQKAFSFQNNVQTKLNEFEERHTEIFSSIVSNLEETILKNVNDSINLTLQLSHSESLCTHLTMIQHF